MADTVTKILQVDLDASAAINGIMRLNEGIETNNNLMAQNKREIKENNAAMKEEGANVNELRAKNAVLAKSNEELTLKTKQLKEEKRILQKEVQNEMRQQIAQEGSLRQLRAQLSNLTRDYDNLSRAERENANVGGKLKAQINQVTTEIKAAEEGTQRYYRNVGNYQNAILNAIGINNQYARSFIDLAASGKGMSGVMANIGASVKAFGQSLLSLLTNPVFLAIAGIAGAGLAFKWFYDYNKGVEEATRLTREFTGVTGTELRNLRAEIQATANTYGKEYLDVLKAVDSISSHYHISSQEALDIVNKGFASGADLSGDMLQKIEQYGPTFADAGIKADELLAIIQQTRSGIFSDQGLDAIRMGSARIREMSDSTRRALEAVGINVDDMMQKLRTEQIGTFDAIKMVSGAIKQLPDNAQEVGEVMTQVFGRQGRMSSQEMIESLQDMETQLDVIIEKQGEHGKALDANREATAEFEKAMANLFQTGEHGWEDMETKAKTYATTALTGVVKEIISIRDQFVKMYKESSVFRFVARTVSAAILGFGQMFTGVFRHIHSGFKAMSQWVVAFLNIFKQAFSIMGDMGKGVGEILTGDFEAGFNRISAAIKRGVTNSMAGFNAALETSGDLVGELFKGFELGWKGIDAAVDSFGGNVFADMAQQLRDLRGGGTDTDTTDTDTTDTKDKSGGKGGSGGKDDAKKAADEQQKLMNNLVQQGEALRKKALQEAAKNSAEAINKLAEAEIEALKKQYGTRAEVEAKGNAEALAAYDALMADIEQRRITALDSLEQRRKKEVDAEIKQAETEAKALAEAIIAGADDGSQLQMEWRLKMLRAQYDAEIAALDANEAMKTERKEQWEAMRAAIVAKYTKQEEQIRQEAAQAQWQAQQTQLTAMGETFGAMGEMFDAFGEKNKAMLVVSKTLSLAQVMMAQAVAIANAVKAGSNAVTPWQMIAQIAASVAAVTAAMMSAFKSLNSAKFATGGYIRGAGTGTSDSIPVRVSNGESIMNANTTAMFGGLLSSLNQLGGGVPIQVTQTAASVRGEDMLARAVARGVAMLPAPVVSVEDINAGQRRVEVINERATL